MRLVFQSLGLGLGLEHQSLGLGLETQSLGLEDLSLGLFVIQLQKQKLWHKALFTNLCCVFIVESLHGDH